MMTLEQLLEIVQTGALALLAVIVVMLCLERRETNGEPDDDVIVVPAPGRVSSGFRWRWVLTWEEQKFFSPLHFAFSQDRIPFEGMGDQEWKQWVDLGVGGFDRPTFYLEGKGDPPEWAHRVGTLTMADES